MKHIRTAVAALLVIGSASFAAAQQGQATQQRQHGEHGQRAGIVSRRGAGHPKLGRALLRGITLSDAEKTNLKAVREKYATQMKALREQYKPQHQAMRDAWQRKDTTALKALRAQNGAERDAVKQLMQGQRADLRAALSAENQAKFDANVARIEKRISERPDSARKRFGRRPGRG